MKDALKTKEELLVEIRQIRRSRAETEAAQVACLLAEQSVRESESKFRSVAQSAVDAIISTDCNDTVIFWNQAAQRIFGYTEDEALGRSVTFIIPEEYREPHRAGMTRYLESRRDVLIGNTVQVEGLRKDGVRFPIELSLATWETHDGVFFTGIIRDISSRKESEAVLEQRTEESRRRTRELESLVQMVAHDLKSPVVTIGGLVRLLKKTLAKGSTDDRTGHILGQLETTSKVMERFLGDLLDGLAVENTVPKRQPVKLLDTIREVISQHAQAADERGIKIVLDVRDGLPDIVGDEGRVRQVIDNLLVNAMRHMGTNDLPTIKVGAVTRQGYVIATVSDNGVGIPESFQAKVFDRFFRVPKDGQPSGTGLGLFIVKHIVESHGGRIWLESEENRGSTFSFTLPVMGPDSGLSAGTQE